MEGDCTETKLFPKMDGTPSFAFKETKVNTVTSAAKTRNAQTKTFATIAPIFFACVLSIKTSFLPFRLSKKKRKESKFYPILIFSKKTNISLAPTYRKIRGAGK
jgi:hypothetical protein